MGAFLEKGQIQESWLDVLAMKSSSTSFPCIFAMYFISGSTVKYHKKSVFREDLLDGAFLDFI